MNTKTPQLDRLMSLTTLHVNMMNTKSNSYCTNTNGRAIFKGNSPLRYSMDLGHNSWYKSVSVSRPNGLSRLSKGAPTRLQIRICIRFPVFPLLESSLIWIFYFVDKRFRFMKIRLILSDIIAFNKNIEIFIKVPTGTTNCKVWHYSYN